jgi:hypothetical protein
MGLGEEKFAGFIAHCLNVYVLSLRRLFFSFHAAFTKRVNLVVQWLRRHTQREAIAFRTLEMQATLITSNESPVLFRARPFARQSFWWPCTGARVPHFAPFCPARLLKTITLFAAGVCPSSLQESTALIWTQTKQALRYNL